jgi:hypothetical protein
LVGTLDSSNENLCKKKITAMAVVEITEQFQNETTTV